ncbi:glycogen synthase GlgA [Bacteroidota bacterium]
MKIAFISSEVAPFSKTGGLADVAGALPKELVKLNNEVVLFTPLYGSIDESKLMIDKEKPAAEISINILDKSEVAKIYKSHLPCSSVAVYFIDSPRYFHRDSYYTDDHDEDERFIFFSKAVIETLLKLNRRPDIIHCNDWHTGLIPVLVKENYKEENIFKKTAFVFTVHNIAFQGSFGKDSLIKAGLKAELYYSGSGVEFFDTVNFLKAGISYSEVINTVSKTYAEEILTKEFGAGMENVLTERKDDLYGIINGVDYAEWSPEGDKFIPTNYSLERLADKEKNKKHLVYKFNLPYRKDVPLIGFVARLTDQKGFDIITEALDDFLKMDAQWIFLGSGDPVNENLLKETAQNYPEKFSAFVGFNNRFAHLIEAGADIFLMPSKYEPCGLNQIYSLKYGTPPIVRRTGGLADTVSDWNELFSKGDQSGTGFVFEEYSAASLINAVKQAVSLFKEKERWRQIQKNGMQKNYSWKKSAEKYVDLYITALNKLKK